MTEELLTPPTGPFFRFPDAVAGMTALDDAGLLDDDLNLITASHTHALDVVGVITRGGEYDPETGDVLAPSTVLDGWHVNYIGELPDGWEEYAVTPANPVRVWAS
jgi:hypothetical protein